MRIKIILAAIAVSLLFLSSCEETKDQPEDTMSAQHKMIQERISRYAPVAISPDMSHLDERQKMLVTKLIEAGEIADKIFWHQSSHDALAVRDSLAAIDTDEARDFLQYVNINFGPYDPLYDNERFVGDGPDKRPPGGGFYPENFDKDHFEAYIKTNPDQDESLRGQYSVVVREGDMYKAIPYHEYYVETEALAAKLEEAAGFADNASLKNYLLLRAEALRKDDYLASDLAWMDIADSDIDIVIGPIENYQDEVYNYRSAHEAVIMVKDPNATAELEMYKENMQVFEDNLPYPVEYRNKNIGEGNIIQVMNVVYFGGDCQQAVKTIAAALPNDPRVAEKKGRKLSMYKNHMEAKFDKIVDPISDILLQPEVRKHVDRKAFTSFVTLHEVSHALGPKYVKGTKNDVRSALKERYSAIEECKADILAMYNHKTLLDKGIYDEDYINKAKNTYLAGLYRSIRFGSGAHYNANLIQLNFLKEKGAIVKENGLLSINEDIFFDSVKELSNLILMTQVEGDYEKAGEILDKYAVLTPELQSEIELLALIPRDIDTSYEH